ncbi:MAG: hypothetical protein HY707_04490 [Ignavibacteriae bacterium]|nr:hypothetical protein [Ignavibacteriota bacterium]
MLTSIQGIYRNGKIELVEMPPHLHGETQVIVTFLSPKALNLRDYGIDEAQASKLRDQLTSFTAGWNNSEMDAYDNYDAAKANL